MKDLKLVKEVNMEMVQKSNLKEDEYGVINDYVKLQDELAEWEPKMNLRQLHLDAASIYSEIEY